jgi:hypothetical protein
LATAAESCDRLREDRRGGVPARRRHRSTANATEATVGLERTRWRVRDDATGEVLAEGTLVAGLYDPVVLAAPGQTLEIVPLGSEAAPDAGAEADPLELQAATIKHQHDVLLYQGDLITNGRTVIDRLRAALQRVAAIDPGHPSGLDAAAQVARDALAASERPGVEGW